MTALLSQIFFSSEARKTLTYYAGYCALFLFSYLALVSTISFFHFLLDHEMRVIESWLTRNAWEILTLAKLLASAVVLKALKLNNYLLKNSLDLIKNSEFFPERKALVLILFLMIFFLALVFQFNVDVAPNTGGSRFLFTSYLGSIVFYLVDLFVIYSALANFPLKRKRQKALLSVALPALFLISTKIALPYSEEASLFLFLHFGSLILLLIKTKYNLMNVILYSFLIIGPMTSVFGFDLVWGDAFSLYLYPKFPALGIFLIWLTGFLYYFRRLRPA
ncbi:MAG: hypothetical protein WD025_01130 [Bacteriovoracaceae bacterium]